jgi:hypothetical protein
MSPDPSQSSHLLPILREIDKQVKKYVLMLESIDDDDGE